MEKRVDEVKPGCPRCGRPMASGEAGGLCPACLLRRGLLSTVEEELETGNRLLGDYELLEPIARGGMGIVYRARQRSLNRLVALKLILTGNLAAPDAIERFRLEVESVAALGHPNIVPIHEVGEEDGNHYFSMPLVEGGSLAERLSKSGRYPVREAVLLVSKLARAVHHAHQRGVLHRDIKPNNILIGPGNEPLLTDFGLAKMIERETRITRTMALLGTPAYLAPEQAAGRGEAVTTAVDIHALGAVLYEVLTGVAPFAADTTAATLRRVIEEDPVPPSRLVPGIGRDLDAVVMKSLEKAPRHRYGSAAAFAEELERWLAGEPLEARPSGWSRRLMRWTRRNPWPAVTLASVVIALLATSVVSEVARRRVAGALVTTRQQKAETERQREATQAELVRSLFLQAEGQWEAGDGSQAVAFWARALRLSPTNETVAQRLWHGLQRSRFPALAGPPTRVGSWAIACGVWSGRPVVSILAEGRSAALHRFPSDPAQSIGRLPLPLPARYLATANDGGTLFAGCGLPGWGPGWAGTIDASGAMSGAPLTNGCNFLSVSPDGTRAIAGSVGVMPWVFGPGLPGLLLEAPNAGRHPHSDHAVWMPSGREILARIRVDEIARYDADTGAVLEQWSHGGLQLGQLSVSADGTRYLVTAQPPGVELGDPRNGKSGFRYSLRLERRVAWAGFLPWGRDWIALTVDGEVTLRDSESGSIVVRRMLGGARTSARLDPTGRRIALWGPGDTVDILDTATLAPACEPVRIADATQDAVFLSPEELLVLSPSGEASRWWLGSAKQTDRPLPPGSWHDGVWSPDGTRVALLSSEGFVSVWDPDADAAPVRIGRHDRASTLRYVAGGRRITSIGANTPWIRCWDPSRPGNSPVWTAGSNVIAAVVDASGQRLLAATLKGTLQVRETETGRELMPSVPGVELVSGLDLEPAGRWALVSEHSGRMRFFDTHTGNFDGQGWKLRNAVLEPGLTSADRLALGHANGELLILDVASRTALPRRLHVPSGFLLPSVRPDGDVLLTASADHLVRRIGVTNGAMLSDPVHIRGGVTALEWDPTGERFLTASELGVVQLHEGISGQSLSGPIRMGPSPISRARFSPDGRRILALDRSGRGLVVSAGPPSGRAIPSWLALAAEWTVAMRLGGGADGRLPQSIPPAELDRIRLELESAVRADRTEWQSIWTSLRDSRR